MSDELSLSCPSHDSLLAVARRAADNATTIIRTQRETHSVSVSLKGDRNLVTTADIAAEKAIIETIQSHFPHHTILAEETAQTLPRNAYGRGPVWVIDPIDGTTNYAHGHYQVGVSIGFTWNGITEVGVVAAPFLHEIFHATRGGGAFLHEKRIAASTTNLLSDALLTTGFPYRRENAANISHRMERLLARCRDIRRLGAASLDLCWVACGRLDGYYEECLQPWDCVAGGLIAREAGATIAHFNYDNELQKMTKDYPGDLYVDNIVVANPALMSEFLSVLNASGR